MHTIPKLTRIIGGLVGLRERLRQLGGTFAITGESEKTAIEASLPLSA